MVKIVVSSSHLLGDENIVLSYVFFLENSSGNLQPGKYSSSFHVIALSPLIWVLSFWLKDHFLDLGGTLLK